MLWGAVSHIPIFRPRVRIFTMLMYLSRVNCNYYSAINSEILRRSRRPEEGVLGLNPSSLPDLINFLEMGLTNAETMIDTEAGIQRHLTDAVGLGLPIQMTTVVSKPAQDYNRARGN